jgi:hypothetical protein
LRPSPHLLAFLFPSEPSLADRDTEARHGVFLLANTDDPAFAAEVIAADRGRDPLPVDWCLDTLLDRMGERIVPVLQAIHTRRGQARDFDYWARVRTVDAWSTLARYVDGPFGGVVSDLLRSEPVLGLAALLRARPRKGSGAAELRDDLARELRHHHAAIRAALPQDLRDRLPVFEVPDEERLPPELAERPADAEPLPTWLKLQQVDQPCLADGTRLSPEGVTNLTLHLQRATLTSCPPVLHDLAFEPKSLAAFGWGLTCAWRDEGHPREARWLLFQLPWLGNARLGNASTARMLAADLVRWTRAQHYGDAVLGVDAVARHGGESALLQVYNLHVRTTSEPLRRRAKQHVDGLARELKLGPEELADRVVPRCGLSKQGTMTLELGSRTLTAFVRRDLTAGLRGDDGPVARFPARRKADDTGTYEAAREAWTGLRKDLRDLAKTQLRRFEDAMISGRRFRGRSIKAMRKHPVLRSLVRSVVWSDKEGTTFRLDETGQPMDVDDEPIRARNPFTIVHPLAMAPEVRAAWSEVFADYEILQPFAQLSRDTFGAEDLAAITEVETGRLHGLRRRGWKVARAEDDTGDPFITSLTGGWGTSQVVVHINLGWRPALGNHTVEITTQVRPAPDGPSGAVLTSELAKLLGASR